MTRQTLIFKEKKQQVPDTSSQFAKLTSSSKMKGICSGFTPKKIPRKPIAGVVVLLSSGKNTEIIHAKKTAHQLFWKIWTLHPWTTGCHALRGSVLGKTVYYIWHPQKWTCMQASIGTAKNAIRIVPTSWTERTLPFGTSMAYSK